MEKIEPLYIDVDTVGNMGNSTDADIYELKMAVIAITDKINELINYVNRS